MKAVRHLKRIDEPMRLFEREVIGGTAENAGSGINAEWEPSYSAEEPGIEYVCGDINRVGTL